MEFMTSLSTYPTHIQISDELGFKQTLSLVEVTLYDHLSALNEKNNNLNFYLIILGKTTRHEILIQIPSVTVIS